MIKVSFFSGVTETGPVAIPLFGPSDAEFEKTAAPKLLPEVSKYIENLRPRNDCQYVLVNAMGACEYYGSNVNGDAFSEASLIHAPDDWRGVPVLDAIKAKNWPYGFPTFYKAKPFLHHRNKDFAPHNHPSFGTVDLAAWNPHMKRVELVCCIEKDKCLSSGGTGLWDKLKMGNFPDVSMGTKVPFDTCSICLDWDRYRKAQASFDPKKHKHPGEAVLEIHKKDPIRGVSITRKDYCVHAKTMMNLILPDGRKVFVYNDYPNFFDISFVFIGADKTAKTMMKLAGEGKSFWFIGGNELAEKLGYAEEDEKTASIGKDAKNKQGEIIKNVLPSQFAAKAVPLLTRSEASLPNDLLDLMGSMDEKKSLATTAGLGIVLRPHEYQRMALARMGRKDLAQELEDHGFVFPKSNETEEISFGEDDFHIPLAKLLAHLMLGRSGFGPMIERRVIVISAEPQEKSREHSSLSSALLHKIGTAYNGYRSTVMQLLPSSQSLMESMGDHDSVTKLASASAEEIFTPLAFQYFKYAFLDECGTDSVDAGVSLAGGMSRRGEGHSPSRNT